MGLGSFARKLQNYLKSQLAERINIAPLCRSLGKGCITSTAPQCLKVLVKSLAEGNLFVQFCVYSMAVMHLASILSADQILVDMKANERWPAILELVELLVEKGHLRESDREPILVALREREEAMSTGIGFGVAIPHASSDRVDRVVAAFGRSRTGIAFDSLDNEPVRFIVLFIVPQDQFSLHLRTLAAIAKFLNERGVRDRLKDATSVDEILETLRGAAARA